MKNLIPSTLFLPKNLISTLQKPLGKLFKVAPDQSSPELQVIKYLENNSSFVFVVGDYVAKTLLGENFHPDLIIIDNFTQRNIPIEIDLPEKSNIIEAQNQPGEISKSAWEILRILCQSVFENVRNSNSKTSKRVLNIIRIFGEEDLLVLPLIIEAPFGTKILYGHPPMIDNDHGIVLIEVTSEIKLITTELLLEFKTSQSSL